MIHMVQPTLFIIILVILVHQSVILASARCYRETYSCAKGVDIDYPFWIADRSLGEGCTNYPGFEVKCGIDGAPVINISISNNLYTVLEINYGYITVREAAINGQECPQPQLNFSTGSTRFLTLHSPENNMTIFYNCSSPPPNIQAQEIPCLKKYYNNSTKHSYAFHGDQIPIGFDWYRNCEKSVFSYVQGDTFSNVEELQQGFYLDYKAPVNCSDCELSGGQCSSNETTGAITCLCPGDINKIDDVCPPKVSAGFCRTNTSCAKGVRIDEPFWIGDESPGVGCTNYPGFRVQCASDGTPVINISNGLYTVLSLSKDDYDEYDRSGYIRVREADINGQECPQPQQNFSIGSTRFLSVDDTNKMRIFYNCSSPPPNIEAQEIHCLEKHYNNSTKHSYGLPDAHIPEDFDWYGNCEKNVLAYIDLYTDLVEALRSGVELSWKKPVNCTDCELSGGQCSSNETTGVITCHCRGDIKKIDDVCPSEVLDGFCYTNTSCGNGMLIDQPFWIGDGSPGVGCTNYPEFRVECANDGTPVMNISNGLYTVLSLSMDDYPRTLSGPSGYIRVREADINDQICPQPQQNLSISSIWLSMYGSANMRIFYNCSSPPLSIEVQEIRCLEKYYNNSAKHSYGFRDAQIPEGFDWYGNCEKNVLTYAYTSSYSPSYTYTDLVEALRWGVELSWKTPVNCTDCEQSGGKCFSNKTTGGFTCDCPIGYGQQINEICPPGSQLYPYTPTIDISIKRRIVIGVSVGVGSSILIFILLCIFRKRIYNSIVSYWRKKIKNLSNVEVFLENYGYLAIQRYKYSDIKKLTNSFKETLGQGGYGSVFKGKLHDGRLVAVKVLNEAKGKGEDFINEVAAIGKTNHVNVVSLLGFCTEKNKRALVYEYMPNGSLERFIYNEKNSNTTSHLGWEKLYEITLGIARGLEYLHRGCNTRILHLDIKPHNILLDQDLCPRISDFGLAKLCPTKESLVSMVGARGTIGYIAPEICCRNFGGVSHKSDVYSYGMMVLEMIGGRKNIDATVENMSEIYFPQWVYTRLERNYTEEGIEDTSVQVLGEFFKDEKMKKMVKVALWCIQPHPGDRPSMSKVVEMLEGKSIELQMPPNPFPDPSSVYSTSL